MDYKISISTKIPYPPHPVSAPTWTIKDVINKLHDDDSTYTAL